MGHVQLKPDAAATCRVAALLRPRGKQFDKQSGVAEFISGVASIQDGGHNSATETGAPRRSDFRESVPLCSQSPSVFRTRNETDIYILVRRKEKERATQVRKGQVE